MKSSQIIQPTPISAPIAHEGLKFNIPENPTGSELASIAEGFPEITMKALADGGLPPRGQDCNGMFYLSTDQKAYLQNGGIITFTQSVSDLIGGYPSGAYLDYINSDGIYTKVKSLIDDNTYNFVTNPEYIDGEKWEEVNLGANQSLTNLTPEGERHFLGQRNISNNIKSAPILVKWHLADGTITLEAGSIVRWAAGKEAPTLNIGDLYNGHPIVDISWDGVNLIYYTQTQQDYSWTFNAYTGYCQMFLQPVEGAEFWGLQTDQVKSGNTPPSSPGNVNYYNTENNTCLHLRDNIPQSFPLMKLWLQGSAGVATAIDVYDTGGCMGSSFWLNKNILINLIDGIDNECGLKSYEYTTTHDRFGYCPPDFTQYNANVWFGITKDSDTTAFNTSILANWNVQNNLQIISTNPNFSISSNPKGLVATNVVVVNGNILSYTPRMPFRIADAQDLDGRYIQASTTLVTSTNIVTGGTQTIDLSSLLPRDNHIYEVIINVAAQTDATVGHTVNFYLSSDITPSFCVFRGRTSVANMNVNCGGNVKIPVGPQRSIVLRNSGTGTAMNISATTSGYRQIH